MGVLWTFFLDIINFWFLTLIFASIFVGNKPDRWISKWVFQENKVRQIFQKTNLSYPLIRTHACAYQGVRNIRFSENLACFVFLKHPFWDSSFCLITDEINVSTAFLMYLWSNFRRTIIIISSDFVRNVGRCPGKACISNSGWNIHDPLFY